MHILKIKNMILLLQNINYRRLIMDEYKVDNYIPDVLRTENKNYDEMAQRFNSSDIIRLTHAGMGLSTETGELLDVLKKHIFYGKPIDWVNLEEEVGDVLWYLALILDLLDISFEEVMKKNIDKLRLRYPNKFTKDDAINRNLEAERSLLES
jgi:NTP pyrophosphatase (non-canonical NTP hydrolase)